MTVKLIFVRSGALAALLTVSMALSGCAQEGPTKESVPATAQVESLSSETLQSTEEGSVESELGANESSISTEEFENLFLELAELDVEARQNKIRETGLTLTEFRRRSLDVYGDVVPSIDWLKNEIEGLSTSSASLVLASFGLFAEFEPGEAAASEELEGKVFDIDEVELRPGENTKLLYWDDYIEPVTSAKPTPLPTQNSATKFSVEYYPKGKLTWVDEIRGKEIYGLSYQLNQGFKEYQFALDVVLSPPTVARCQIMTSDRNFKTSGNDYGWEYRTADNGRVTVYSYKIPWANNLKSYPRLFDPLWVRCSRGDYFSDSRLFSVVKAN